MNHICMYVCYDIDSDILTCIGMIHTTTSFHLQIQLPLCCQQPQVCCHSANSGNGDMDEDSITDSQFENSEGQRLKIGGNMDSRNRF